MAVIQCGSNRSAISRAISAVGDRDNVHGTVPENGRLNRQAIALAGGHFHGGGGNALGGSGSRPGGKHNDQHQKSEEGDRGLEEEWKFRTALHRNLPVVGRSVGGEVRSGNRGEPSWDWGCGGPEGKSAVGRLVKLGSGVDVNLSPQRRVFMLISDLVIRIFSANSRSPA